jgi:DNA-binding CsgD family transcriptional regulator
VATADPRLEDGRRLFAAASWREAYDALAAADAELDLGPSELELLARAAYMVGRDDDYVAGLERAHHAHVRDEHLPRAVRCAFWIGHNLMFRGHGARANGWFSLGVRLLENPRVTCVEQGYLLIPVWLEQMGSGNWAEGLATATRGAEIGERFGDPDLLWLARDESARAMLRQGMVTEGLSLVDEVLVVVDSGTLSPIVSGIIYCNTIAFCRDVHAERQAREWTDALAAWCDAQPQMVAHQGLCLVHRAEVMQLRGDWPMALEAAATAAEHFTDGALNQIARGRAHYRQGEIHRLEGRLDEAERCYLDANACGYEPQPGLALRRAVTERVDPLLRAELLPPYVEIMIALGDVDAARAAAGQLEELTEQQGTESLAAMTHHARACGALAEGDVAGCLTLARLAWHAWHNLEAPYEAAHSRVLVARACRHLGDTDSAEMELRTARDTFVQLRATRDIGLVDELAQPGGSDPSDRFGLSHRELQVLGLVVGGRTNRQIAAELAISEHTVARHLQNMFAKLGVTSRTAATTFALEHDLVPLARGHN